MGALVGSGVGVGVSDGSGVGVLVEVGVLVAAMVFDGIPVLLGCSVGVASTVTSLTSLLFKAWFFLYKRTRSSDGTAFYVILNS